MAKGYIDDSVFGDIADAIRVKRGSSGTYVPGDMAQAILDIEEPPEWYDGSYIVTPSWSSQDLATEGLRMRDDVSVSAIPRRSVTNEAGGYTVTIG